MEKIGSGRTKTATSETRTDRAKVTVNGLYKVVHMISIAAKIIKYDLA